MSIDKEIGVQSLLGYKLKKTQHALRIQMDEALRVLDLTTPQYAVLAQLELKPGTSNATLARSAFITAQTMHGIVSNLERRGFVRRESDASHGRILCTELTDQGYKVVTQAHDMIRAVESRMLATISDEHRALFEELLLEFFNNLRH
ncbi:MarR family transcriptional regulator [Rickettsiales endosymbiont of Paramecium tredecaurelia]|uniref:MarR family winged helix-turn-helix transcriptional regulator n=1 Tax=Candidatus Sarmatiella mevalonica TaxID=2770581 RepID=UPI0019250906|nr:MarR family transcriptional regulator [Candidatus Sarmatiella mevalonica]MBL3284325.1 MarR family transcriptional regulator [Candidatus Sarmatiella mevalonica]